MFKLIKGPKKLLNIFWTEFLPIMTALIFTEMIVIEDI